MAAKSIFVLRDLMKMSVRLHYGLYLRHCQLSLLRIRRAVKRGRIRVPLLFLMTRNTPRQAEPLPEAFVVLLADASSGEETFDECKEQVILALRLRNQNLFVEDHFPASACFHDVIIIVA